MSEAKTAPSLATETELVFAMEGVTIRERIRRRDFERWIAPELAQIDAALEQVLRYGRSGSPMRGRPVCS